jgi:hypothetical protein
MWRSRRISAVRCARSRDRINFDVIRERRRQDAVTFLLW